MRNALNMSTKKFDLLSTLVVALILDFLRCGFISHLHHFVTRIGRMETALAWDISGLKGLNLGTMKKLSGIVVKGTHT